MTVKGKRKSVRFGDGMYDGGVPTEGVTLVSKFAGEAFGTDNVRTVFADASQDDYEREDRVILLIGPAGTGKSTLIDCMCNFFYGAQLDSDVRYKIADEIFDQTTPKKTIIRYVFNGTAMPYRPIVIDTPGIGGESGIQTDAEISEMLTGFLLHTHRVIIHAIGFVLRYDDSRISLKREAQIRETLSLFPRWMLPNIVPILTNSDGTRSIPTPIASLFKHLALSNNPVFYFNSQTFFDKSDATVITEQLRSKYWNMTMQGLEGLFEQVGQLNPQCIAEEIPVISPPLSPSLIIEKHGSSDGTVHTPNYTPPPPPPSADLNISGKRSSDKWSSGSGSASTRTATKTSTRSQFADEFEDVSRSKIRRTLTETMSDSHRERIIPIKLLHTPSKTSLERDTAQVVENRRSLYETRSEQQIGGMTDAGILDTEDASTNKRYTYDPSSMSHKQWLLTTSNKELTTGDGIDLITTTPGAQTTFGVSPLSHGADHVMGTLISNGKPGNGITAGGYTHIESSPPPEYTVDGIPQRLLPLASLADGNTTHQDTSATTFSRSSAHRQLDNRSYYRETAITEPSPALSDGSHWAYTTGDLVTSPNYTSSMHRDGGDKTMGESLSQDKNDFIITQQMKRSRSPIVVRVTMGQKDKGTDEQTPIDTSKKHVETTIDDVATPEYDSTWNGQVKSSAYTDMTCARTTDVISGYASTYAHNGTAAALATKTSPLFEDNVVESADVRMGGGGYANYGDENNAFSHSKTTAATATGQEMKTQVSHPYDTNQKMTMVQNHTGAGGDFSDDETTTQQTTRIATTTGGAGAAASTGRYQKNQSANWKDGSARRSRGYGSDEEDTVTTTKTTLITGGGTAGAIQGRALSSSRGGAGYGYDDDEETTTTKTVTTAGGGTPGAIQGRSLSSSRAGAGYGYDDDEETTTTKTVTTAGGFPRGALSNMQNTYGSGKRASGGYGYDDEETTTTKTTSNLRYDLPPGESTVITVERKEDLEKYLGYRDENEDLLARHSSFHGHPPGMGLDNFQDSCVYEEKSVDRHVLTISNLRASSPKLWWCIVLCVCPIVSTVIVCSTLAWLLFL